MVNSFRYAINGIKDALKSEPNLRFHFLASLIVILSANYLRFNTTEFAVLILIISFVIVLELVNTIVEKLVDMYSKEISEEARIIKDISAGIVLFGAITSVVIGFLLFSAHL